MSNINIEDLDMLIENSHYYFYPSSETYKKSAKKVKALKELVKYGPEDKYLKKGELDE